MALAKRHHLVIKLLTLLTSLGWLLTSHAEPIPLWELQGTNNRVLLMGSVHFLRPADYPLPPPMDAAYDNADLLVMEIDMDDLDPIRAQAVMTRMGISSSKTLSQTVGASSYAEAQQLAAPVGIPLALFDSFEPWFAALSISQLRMIQLGFDPSWGVESQLTQRARTDGKTIIGLETLEQQLGFMDQLDDETQRLFLLESLREANEMEQEIQSIVTAWKSGDTATLETMLLQGLEQVPELYGALLVDRNRNWVPEIIALTERSEDVLVVVGAMHLVGDQSVLAMLADRGIESRQLDSDE